MSRDYYQRAGRHLAMAAAACVEVPRPRIIVGHLALAVVYLAKVGAVTSAADFWQGVLGGES